MIGKTISHYKIVEKLGEGGMGTVYKALDLKLDREVALKFLPPHLSTTEEIKARFIHEAKSASALEHINICNIHEIDETEDGNIFICMAFYDGETLKERIERGPLKISEVMDIALQIGEGLAKAHSKEIVHRDIKPANILITNEGIVKIVDFGLAKMKGITRLTREKTTLGTVDYMSPEQARGEEVDHRTDIWALGVILYEMLSGQPPFKGAYEQAVIYSILNEEHEPISALRKDIPEALEKIINRCLEKDPAARYQTTEEVVSDLRTLQKELEPEKHGGFLFRQKSSTLVKSLLALMSLTVITLTILLYFFWKPAGPFTSYESAFFEADFRKAMEKSKKQRNLKNVKAHYIFLASNKQLYPNHYPETVKAEYRQLFRKNPQSALARFYLGLAYLFSREWRAERDSAFLLIHQAEEMGFHHPYMDLAKLSLYHYFFLPDRAMDNAHRLVEKYPQEPLFLMKAALAYQNIAYDSSKARKYFQQAVKVYPKFIEPHLYLSKIALENRDFQTAKYHLEQANKVNPEYHRVIRAFAQYYEREGRFEEAEKYYLKAIQASGEEKHQLYFGLADLYLKQDKIADGLKILKLGLEKFPRHSELLWELQQLKSRERWLKSQRAQKKEQKLIPWLENFEDALAKAKLEKKPLLVDFFTYWCYWCRILEEKTYPHPRVQQQLASFIPVRVNAEVEVELAKKYNINAYPTLKILAEDGESVYEIIGYKKPEKFVLSLQEGLTSYQRYRLGKTMPTHELTEVSNLEDARILSRNKKEPIMVLFSSNKSKWSNKLVEETIGDPTFRSEFSDIIYVNLDYQANRQLAQQWQVTYVPSILFLDSEANILHKTYGFKPPEVLGDIVKELKKSYHQGHPYLGGIQWLYDFEEAKALALLEKKYIFVDFTAAWCPPCQWLSEFTFQDPRIIQKLNSDYIPLQLDEKRNRNIFPKFGITSFPTLLILDPGGEILNRSVGYQDPDQLLSYLENDIYERRILAILGPIRYREYQKLKQLTEALHLRELENSVVAFAKKQQQMFPELGEVYYTIGHSLIHVGKQQEAIGYFHKALESNARIDENFIHSVIDAYLQVNDVEGLKEWFKRAREIRSDEAETLVELYLGSSELFEILQNYPLAVQHAKKAVEVKPNSVRAQSELGRLLFETDQFDEARKHLKIATQLDERNILAWFFLGLVAEKEGHPKEREKCFTRVLENPNYAGSVILLRAYMYLERPNYFRYPGYLDIIEKGFQYGTLVLPEDNFLKNKFAFFLANEKRNLTKALALINEALQEEPDRIRFKNTKAAILYQMGKIHEANQLVQEYENLLSEEVLKRDGATLYFLGKIKEAVGDTVSARKYFEKLVNLREPDSISKRRQMEIQSAEKAAKSANSSVSL